MEIIKTVDGNNVTISIVGTIDTVTSTKLNEELLSLDYEGLDLTIDFAKTSYITSAGLRVLLVARKKLTDDKMRIINASDEIIDVFKTTGFDTLIKIEKDDFLDDGYRLSFSSLLKKRLESDCKNTAFIYLNRPYTWDDLDKMSQIVADDLSLAGVKKGTHVGICAPNSINWVVTFFAIQKLGGIAVLINPALLPNEVLSLAKIGDVTHLCYAEIPGITTFDDYKNALLGDTISLVYDISSSVDFTKRFDEFDNIKDKYQGNFLADDASVIIYSSGSTGLPKAILASSFSIMSSIESFIKEYELKKQDINLAFLPFFHIFGLATGVALAVLSGYTSIIPESKSPDLIIELIDKYKCTIFNSVPAMMLAIIGAKTFASEKLASLRVSVLGGATTTESQFALLKKFLPNNHFGNIYGMSENAAISLTLYNDTTEHILKTVGKPAPGLELSIRDLSTGEVLKKGQEGEICIRSNAMVVCYYHLPIDKQPVDDEGWLLTGDIGVLDDDGYLRLVGRKKDLIICGGENISPGEIAEEMTKLPEIKDVKVLGLPHEVKGEVVVAAIILKDGATWDENAAKAELSKHLAKYKIPVRFFVFDSFPLLGSGKVDGITIKKQIIESL